ASDAATSVDWSGEVDTWSDESAADAFAPAVATSDAAPMKTLRFIWPILGESPAPVRVSERLDDPGLGRVQSQSNMRYGFGCTGGRGAALERKCCAALRSSRLLLTAPLFFVAGCSSCHHVSTQPRWLEPAPALAPPPSAGHAGTLRVAVYGDTRGNRPVHREVVAAISAQKPDLVIFTGDAVECLPVGHLPDYSGWQYAIPLWPQIHRHHPSAHLASLGPFPALLHDTVGSPIARPRDPDGFNGFLEDTDLLRKASAPLLFVPGNHDLYHRWDRQALARLQALPSDRLWYAVDVGDYRFVVLDTGTDLFGDSDA